MLCKQQETVCVAKRRAKYLTKELTVINLQNGRTKNCHLKTPVRQGKTRFGWKRRQQAGKWGERRMEKQCRKGSMEKGKRRAKWKADKEPGAGLSRSSEASTWTAVRRNVCCQIGFDQDRGGILQDLKSFGPVGAPGSWARSSFLYHPSSALAHQACSGWGGFAFFY